MLTLKRGEDPDDYGVASLSLRIECRHNLTEEDNVAALVGVTGPTDVNTIFNITQMIESKDQEVTCALLTVAICRIRRMSSALFYSFSPG